MSERDVTIKLKHMGRAEPKVVLPEPTQDEKIAAAAIECEESGALAVAFKRVGRGFHHPFSDDNGDAIPECANAIQRLRDAIGGKDAGYPPAVVIHDLDELERRLAELDYCSDALEGFACHFCRSLDAHRAMIHDLRVLAELRKMPTEDCPCFGDEWCAICCADTAVYEAERRVAERE